MTKTGAVMSAAITAPLVKVGKEIYEAGTSFYSQMSRVEAISGANATQMEALTAKAIEMGSTTSFTATEAGKALEYMAMAGWKSDEMLAGLAPIMDLAAASGEELAATSDIVTDALTAFGLTANDAAMFSDVLAAAATNSNTNVGMMGETFKYVAPVAGALGYTIQDTAVAIGLMANSGIKGSQAGTALRNVLTNMAKPTDTVQAAMDKLGVSLTDASGSVIPLNQVLTTLRSSFSQLSEAEKTQYATMLAGKYGMSGLLAIVNATDEEFQSLTDSINDAEGATSRMAATILDNAQGDVTIFKSAIEGLEITLWGLVDGPFRSIVQTATKWVDSFREMDSATQVAVLKVGALAAALGPALIMGGRVVKVVGKLIPLMRALASPMGIITGALALFAVAAVDANNDIGKSFAGMSKKVGSSLKKVNAEIQGKMQTISKRMPALCASIVEGVQNIVPEFMDTSAREAGYKKDIAGGCMCADCVGLIKAFFWKGGSLDGANKYGANNCPDKSANGMYSLCKENGPIGTIPDIPGIIVWKSGHIGVYVGNGYTVEMQGFVKDCVKRKVTEGSWTNWGKLPASMLSYVNGSVETPTYKLGDRTLQNRQ